MEKLLAFINSLTEDQRFDFAEGCKTSIGYLRKAISTGQQLGEGVCVLIQTNSAGAVTVLDLRPDFADKLAAGGYVRYQRPPVAQAAKVATA